MPTANANDFTWEQRGAVDYIIGVPFSGCQAESLFDRDEWEKGYIEAHARFTRLFHRPRQASTPGLMGRPEEI